MYRKLPDVGTATEPTGSVTPGVGGGISTRMCPNRAGTAPSQCCSKFASKSMSSLYCEYAISLTVNLPVRVLQPRPSPDTSRPGTPSGRNAERTAPVYDPTARGTPLGAEINTPQLGPVRSARNVSPP